MGKFYFLLWLKWALRVSVVSVFLACCIAFVVTLGLYLFQGALPLNAEVLQALGTLFVFWFALAWNLALLVALFRSFKTLFNDCLGGYRLQLLACSTKEPLEMLGYGDILKAWRKWFVLLIWIVSALMVFAVFIATYLLSYESIFGWFSIYWLYLFILVGGYISFILLGSRCKNVRIKRC